MSKKTFLLLVVLIFTGLIITGKTFAATDFTMTPDTIKVAPGQSFKISIYVDPHNIENYTEKITLKFPASLVGLNKWEYSTDWMPLRQKGYDYFSNDEGVLTRTGGYPGGFSKKLLFGTATFVAKGAGSDSITFSGTSGDILALDGDSNNVFGSGNKVALVVGSEAPKPKPAPVPTPAPTPKATPAPAVVAPKFAENISINLGMPKVLNIESLGTNIEFSDFDTKPTDIALTFAIIDSNGIVVHTENSNLTVQTKQTLTKNFTGFDLQPGKYTLRVTAIIGKDTRTTQQDFEIATPPAPIPAPVTSQPVQEKKADWNSVIIGILLFIILILLVVLIIAVVAQRQKKRRER